MHTPTLYWDPTTTPDELQIALGALSDTYSLTVKPKRNAIALRFSPGGPAGTVAVSRTKNIATIHYDRPHHALRGVGAILANLIKSGSTWTEMTPFKTFGIMLDCSRNAVMTVTHIQKWLRQLAMLGYNMVMLYTEDTYEITGEPCFGYLRGRYTSPELKEIDDYAAQLGIEVIGCIQTLGHLEQILKWPAYSKVYDTSSVLLVDEPATYALIDKMVATFAANYRSRRIHIGMDEVHDLGHGVFLDRFGHQRGFDIFNRHLAKVVEICSQHGLQPMIWSDMYFRMGSTTHNYYDEHVRIPDDVKAAIPENIQLVYWDYYHDNAEFYAGHIERHRKLGKEPLMASGVWTWLRLWYDAEWTIAKALPSIQASRNKNLEEFFFTLWGDDGAYCEFDSAMAGLALGAEAAYRGESYPATDLHKRFAAICDADYQVVETFSRMTRHNTHAVLWDDPLLGIWWKAKTAEHGAQYWLKVLAEIKRLLAKTSKYAKVTQPIDLSHGVNLLVCLTVKLELGVKLHRAYAKRDTIGLEEVKMQIPQMLSAIDALLTSYRRQWLRRNKHEGFEVIQIRLAGLKQRYIELSQRLSEFTTGKLENISELEQTAGVTHRWWNWRSLATGSNIL